MALRLHLRAKLANNAVSEPRIATGVREFRGWSRGDMLVRDRVVGVMSSTAREPECQGFLVVKIPQRASVLVETHGFHAHFQRSRHMPTKFLSHILVVINESAAEVLLEIS
jgi:hypothetical protein